MARTIVVGDVHGCASELGRLLELLAPGNADHVIFVGDLVARGPDTHGVLALVREVRGRAVLGNHEARLLDARRAARLGQRRPRLAPPDYVLLRQLSDAEWEWLSELPLWLELPEHGACIVHAGVQAGVELAAHDPWTITHMRSLDPDGFPSERHDLVPWAQTYQSATHVVFGHNSRLGLQLEPCATGIDTGCVYGGQLSALVLGPRQHVPADIEERRQLIRAVPAARRYYVGRG